MKRAGFLGFVSLCAGLSVAIAAGSACSDGTGSTPKKDSGVDGAIVVDGDLSKYLNTLGEECLAKVIINGNTDPLTVASLDAAAAAFTAGKSDIAISPTGCTRLLVERKDGAIVSETLIGAPWGVAVNGNDAGYRGRVSKWTYAQGSRTALFDADGDGFYELREVTQNGTQSVVETYAKGDVLVSRTTTTVASGGKRLDIKDEAVVDAKLTTVRTRNVSVYQKTCLPPQARPEPSVPSGPDDATTTRPCTPTEKTAISNAIGEALVKETGCLSSAGRTDWSDQVLKTSVHSEFKIECSDDYSQGEWAAANDRGYREMFPGQARIMVSGKGLGRPDLVSTIGHELSHFGQAHDSELEAASTVNGFVDPSIALSDPVYACEAACFDPKATVCHLAACAGKKLGSVKGNCPGTLTDEDIQRFEQARGSSLASCNTGHQVGALCRNVQGGSQVQFCTTAAECNIACGFPCESKSVSCDPTCR